MSTQKELFLQWREWFDGISRESGLVEFKQATDFAIENLATQGIEFSSLQPSDEVFLDTSIESYYLWDQNGNFIGLDSFSSSTNTFVFNADSTVDFFGMNYREGFNNDSEVVMLAGSVDFDGTRLISLGDPLTPDVEDWDAINFSELASEVNIDLEDLNSDFFDVTVTNDNGDVIAFVGGAEAVFGSDFNDDIAGDAEANILHGSDGDDIVLGNGGNDLLLGGAGSQDFVIGGAGEDVIVELDGGTVFGNEAFFSSQGEVTQSSIDSSKDDDVFVVGSSTTIKDFDLSTEGVGLAGNANQAADIVFVQLDPAALIAVGVSADAVLSYADPVNSTAWGAFLSSLSIGIVDEISGSKQIQISLDGSAQVLGAVSFFDTGNDAGKSFNPVTLDMNVQSVISGFESTVSDNRHILEQFVDFDFSSTLYVPIAVEAVRAGLIRAEVVDRVTDPTDPDAADFERVFIVDRPTNSEAAQAAIFVLGNADDKVVSTGGTGDRFEFVPQGYRGSDDLLLSDQSFGNDVIVDLARRDPEFSKTDDVIFLKGVTSIDEVVMSRTSVGREGNTSLKIQTSIESDGTINDGEITVFKQFDPLVNRFAVEKLEIETLTGDIQVWSLPTAAAIRDGRRIVDTVIESNIGDTGRAIFIGNDVGQSKFKLTSETSSEGLAFGGLTNFDIKFINWKEGDTVDLSSIGLANDFTISAGVLLEQGGGESFALDADGKISVTNPGYTFLTELQSGDLLVDGYAAVANDQGGILAKIDTDNNWQILGSGETLAGTGGHDQLSLMGSGFVKASVIGIEELVFDGAASEVIVRATGMNSITTLTFSGQGTNAPSLSGLGDQDLTVNAILDSSWNMHQVISSGGALTVNLNGDPERVSLSEKTDNDFDFQATTDKDVTINVGQYVSASGTYTLSNVTGSVTVNVDPTSTFGGHIYANEASSISIMGSGAIAATISGAQAQTINIDVGSAGIGGDPNNVAIGTPLAKTLNVSSKGDIYLAPDQSMIFFPHLHTFNDPSYYGYGGLSGIENLAVNIVDGDALFNPFEFKNMQTLSISGEGSSAGTHFGIIGGNGNTMQINMDGLTGGFSAGQVTNDNGNVEITAGDMLEGLRSHEINITSISAQAVSLTVGEGTGSITLGAPAGFWSYAPGVFAHDSVTIDAANFGGTIDAKSIFASGSVAVTLGDSGDFSSGGIYSDSSFVLDAQNAVAFDDYGNGGSIFMTEVRASGVVIAAGDIGYLTFGNYQDWMNPGGGISSGGAITIDASQVNFFDASNLQADDAITLSIGERGDFSGGSVSTGGAFTLDASQATSGQVNISSVSAASNINITMGQGTGSIILGNYLRSDGVISEGYVNIDTSTFGGTVDVHSINAQDFVNVSLGGNGDFSSGEVLTDSSFTLDASTAVSGSVTIGNVEVDSNVNILMGSGSGHATIGTHGYGVWHPGIESDENVTIDAQNFQGSFNTNAITASGNINISLGGTLFSAGDIDTLGDVNISIEGTSGSVMVGSPWESWDYPWARAGIDADAVSINLGASRGDLRVEKIDSQSTILISGSNSQMAIDVDELVASGDITVSLGHVYSSEDSANISSIETQGTFTLDGQLYREKFDNDWIFASGVVINFGDLSDEFDSSGIITETFSLNGGDGANFSANITSLDIGASGWSISMPELGNGLTLPDLSFSGGGVLLGTMSTDNISAVSTSQAGDTVTVEFDLREDSWTDVLDYNNGGGKEYVILRNFKSGSDDLDLSPQYGSSTWTTGLDVAVGVATAASIIGAALGATVATGDVATAQGIFGGNDEDGNATALFTYQGDTWLVSDGDGDAMWEDGEVIFRFVGVTDILSSDITFADG